MGSSNWRMTDHRSQQRMRVDDGRDTLSMLLSCVHRNTVARLDSLLYTVSLCRFSELGGSFWMCPVEQIATYFLDGRGRRSSGLWQLCIGRSARFKKAPGYRVAFFSRGGFWPMPSFCFQPCDSLPMPMPANSKPDLPQPFTASRDRGENGMRSGQQRYMSCISSFVLQAFHSVLNTFPCTLNAGPSTEIRAQASVTATALCRFRIHHGS